MKHKSCFITKKTLVIVAYRFNIEGLLELNTEVPTFYQVRHVAQTLVIAASVALWDPTSSSDISYVHNSKIKLVQLNICTKKPKLYHYYSSRVDYRSVESFLENSQHNKGLAQVEEGKTTPTTTVGILLLSYMVQTFSFVDCHVWSLDRLKVNPKCHLIIFLENPGPSIFPTYSNTSHAKKGHIERLKFTGTEMNQQSGVTWATRIIFQT